MLISLLLACTGTTVPLDSTSTCDLCGGGCLEVAAERPSGAHVTGGITYEDPPPWGGDHDPCWAEWGVYDEELADERWVHNLEHGGVVFLYNCPDGCADEVTELSAYVTSQGPTAILSPYAEMSVRFAVVAWGARLLLDCLDLDAMRSFYKTYVDHGPESSTSGPSSGCMEGDTGG